MKLKTFIALFFAVAIVTAPSAWFGAYYGVQQFHVALADPPAGNGGAPGILGPTDTTLTQTGTTLGINLSNANTWTAAQTFSNPTNIGAGSGSCPATVIAICGASNQGATNIIAAAFGPQSAPWGCTSSCTVSNSTQTCWYRSIAGGPDNSSGSACQYLTSGGSMIMATGGSGSSFGNHPVTMSKVLQNASGNFGGTCTAASNTCTVTLTVAFTTPICFGVDQTTAAPVKATASSTTLTLVNASPGGATDILGGFCIGNPT